MKITALDAAVVTLKIANPVAISFHTFTTYQLLFVKLTTASGLVGWGEAAPFEPITNDSIESATAELIALRSHGALELESLTDFHHRHLSAVKSPTLCAALDMAAAEILAKQMNVPVYRLFVDTPHRAPNSVTVFLQSDDRSTFAEARRILLRYPDLAVLKVKLSGKDDLLRAKAIKSAERGEIAYSLDANQGYLDETQALRTLEQIHDILGKVILVEEPFAKGSYAKMRYLTERLSVPIFADESCTDSEDLARLIAEECVRGINIKLQKAGGIVASRKLATVAASAGLAVMFGQMLESPLATAASIHTAASLANVVLTDLDMDLELPPFCTTATSFVNGERIPLDVSGFGFAFNESELERLLETGMMQIEKI